MIVVTTPTGNIGSKILAELLSGTEPVRVVVRNASRLPKDVRDQVDVIEGSHGDPAVVDKAFRHANSVFWLAPPDPKTSNLGASYLDFARPACDAFRTHGVQRVVAVSNLGRGTPLQNHAGVATASFRTCDLIAASGVHLRSLALPAFMDNFLRLAGDLKANGAFSWPVPSDQAIPICSTGDIAQVAARLLVDHTWTGTSDYPVLGPENLTMNEMADILTEVLGRPIRFVQMAFVTFRDQLVSHGMSTAFADGVTEMFEAKAKGLDHAAPRTSESTTHTTFRQWTEQCLKPAVVALA